MYDWLCGFEEYGQEDLEDISFWQSAINHTQKITGLFKKFSGGIPKKLVRFIFARTGITRVSSDAGVEFETKGSADCM